MRGAEEICTVSNVRRGARRRRKFVQVVDECGRVE
jgi:hypothetical protein